MHRVCDLRKFFTHTVFNCSVSKCDRITHIFALVINYYYWRRGLTATTTIIIYLRIILEKKIWHAGKIVHSRSLWYSVQSSPTYRKEKSESRDKLAATSSSRNIKASKSKKVHNTIRCYFTEDMCETGRSHRAFLLPCSCFYSVDWLVSVKLFAVKSLGHHISMVFSNYYERLVH